MLLPSFFLTLLPFKKYTVAGKSMEPTIKEGATVIIRNVCKYDVNEVVAVSHPTKQLVILKRIKKINGGKIFVIGDNQKESTDSRHFGTVSQKRILGKVVALL